MKRQNLYKLCVFFGIFMTLSLSITSKTVLAINAESKVLTEYIDEHGAFQQVEAALLEDSDETVVLNDGWYIANGEIAYPSGLKINGKVRIILADNCRLVSVGRENYAGIEVTTENSLCVYAQSTQRKNHETKASKLGELIASGGENAAAIGGGNNQGTGEINIYGGNIIASSGILGTGIGSGRSGNGGSINILGGIIDIAVDHYGVGIGGGKDGSVDKIVILPGAEKLIVDIGAFGKEIGNSKEIFYLSKTPQSQSFITKEFIVGIEDDSICVDVFADFSNCSSFEGGINNYFLGKTEIMDAGEKQNVLKLFCFSNLPDTSRIIVTPDLAPYLPIYVNFLKESGLNTLFQKGFSVMFDSNGGNVIAAKSATPNEKILEIPEPIKKGHSFLGWFKDKELNTAWDSGNDVIVGDLQLYAKWAKNNYTIIYNANNGSDLTSVNMEFGSKLNLPSAPERIGYSFSGWHKDISLTEAWRFDADIVEGDITLFAKWMPSKNIVRFKTDDGSKVNEIFVEYGNKIPIPEIPQKDGYSFSGWFKDYGLIHEWDFANDKLDGETTLYAKWAPLNFLVDFNTNGANELESMQIEYGTKISAPSVPEKPNYSFIEWYADSKLQKVWNFDKDIVQGNTTLYAKWQPKKYNVSFDSSGGSTIIGYKADYGSVLLPPADISKNGYEFIGWYNDLELRTPWDFAANIVEGDVTLHAKWKPKKYFVEFDSGGGNKVPIVYAEFGSKIMEPGVSRNGYNFMGWYKESVLESLWDFEKDIVDNNVRLYAKWIPIQVEVKFNAEDGKTTALVTADFGTKISAPPVSQRAGHRFVGWFKDAGFVNSWDFENDRAEQNTTLYACWLPIEYGVNFCSNGGNQVGVQRTNYGETTAMPDSPIRLGYIFGGWYKEMGLNTLWNFETDTPPLNGKTLYAKWIPEQKKISFETNNGEVFSPLYVDFGTRISPQTVERLGYSFKGWHTDAELTNEWDFENRIVDNDYVLYAKWIPKNYMVSFDSCGGSGDESVQVEYGDKLSSRNILKKGHSLVGWYTDMDYSTAWDFDTNVIDRDTILYAKWIADKYIVNFNTDGGSEVTPLLADYGSTLAMPKNGNDEATSLQGFKFMGWYKEASTINKWDFDKDIVEDNLTLYAKWELDTISPALVNSGKIIISNVTDTSLTINWGEAYGENADKNKLKYYVYKSEKDDIGDVETCRANGALINMSNHTGILGLNVEGLKPSISYFFNVLAEDASGMITAYTAEQVTTKTTLPTPLASGSEYVAISVYPTYAAVGDTVTFTLTSKGIEVADKIAFHSGSISLPSIGKTSSYVRIIMPEDLSVPAVGHFIHPTDYK